MYFYLALYLKEIALKRLLWHATPKQHWNLRHGAGIELKKPTNPEQFDNKLQRAGLVLA
jgi:hypothetical protein